MMLKFFSVLLMAIVLALSANAAAPLSPSLKIQYDTLGTWQFFTQSNDTNSLPNLSSGFQNANSNLRMWVNLLDGVDVYADYYISVPPHAGQFYADEGYIKVSKLPKTTNLLNLNGILFDRGIEVKAGQFELDYGNNHLYRSNNADSSRNPLIGNYLVDANVVEFGLEMIGQVAGRKWVLGAGNGVNSQDFNSGRSYSLHGKIGDDQGLALSFYRANNSLSSTAKAGLFTGPRSGSQYAAGTVASTVLTGTNAGNLSLGWGKNVTAYQLDFGFGNGKPVEIKGMVGFAGDTDPTTEAKDTWTYYGVEAKLSTSNPDLYFAARYSGARTNLRLGVSMDNAQADRLQLGLGYNIIEGTIFKTELVYEKYNNFTATYTGNPYFYGIITQISTSFPLFDNLVKKS